jgi:hypothetical protein
MKKDRKKQEDRLLKQLKLSERREQEKLRALIAKDMSFASI